MNEDQLKGKYQQFKGAAQVWWGQTAGDFSTEFEGHKDKIIGYLEENLGMAKDQAEKEFKKLEAAVDEFQDNFDDLSDDIKAKFQKFTDEDLVEIKGDLAVFAEKVKERYHTTQKEANEMVKEFMDKYIKK